MPDGKDVLLHTKGLPDIIGYRNCSYFFYQDKSPLLSPIPTKWMHIPPQTEEKSDVKSKEA